MQALTHGLQSVARPQENTHSLSLRLYMFRVACICDKIIRERKGINNQKFRIEITGREESLRKSHGGFKDTGETLPVQCLLSSTGRTNLPFIYMYIYMHIM